MDDTRDITQDCQQDVDEQVSSTTTLEEDTDGREDDGKDNFANVSVMDSQLAIRGVENEFCSIWHGEMTQR